MTLQLSLCIETLWTFTACIWPYTFMSKYMTLKLRTSTVFLLANVTCQPRTFIVWLQQMSLELGSMHKTLWTVSTWVRLCTGMNTNMKLHMPVYLKELPTVRTLVQSYIVLCAWRWCVCMWRKHLKLLLHTEHLYGLSSVWTLMWVRRCTDWQNAFLHTWHLYGFSPVWTLMWVCRFPFWLNTFSHTWHLYGFSPLWILLCTTRSRNAVNCLLQTVHKNGFSPEWRRLCSLNSVLLRKQFPHSVHMYLLLWTFVCLSKQCRSE